MKLKLKMKENNCPFPSDQQNEAQFKWCHVLGFERFEK